MKQEMSTGVAQRPFARHRLQMLGLALTVAPFAWVGEAQALCSPNAPTVDGAIVTCSGATLNQNTPNGYGTATDINNTYNIQVGASVDGTNLGFKYDKGAIFNNSGAISGIVAIAGGDATVHNLLGGATISGIVGAVSANLLTLDNAGTISATGGASEALNVTDLNLNGNTGTITARLAGIHLLGGNATINSTGTISGTGLGGFGIRVQGGATQTINASGNMGAGTISGEAAGIKSEITNANLIVSNGTGTIIGTNAATGIGILALQNLT